MFSPATLRLGAGGEEGVNRFFGRNLGINQWPVQWAEFKGMQSVPVHFHVAHRLLEPRNLRPQLRAAAVIVGDSAL
jgi:hypothetical protein